jgi:pimeloyl-ACP methyl ester carboxylesterase
MRRFLIIPTCLVLVFAAAAAPAVTYHLDGHTQSDDGVTIAYEVWGNAPRAIVFVHGWSCDRNYWQNQFEYFSGAFQVVAIDLAGHGESGTERAEYTMEAFGADVAAVLRQQGITDAVLVGHSMGGPVIVEAALQAADRVSGLIGVDDFQDMHTVMTDEQIDAWLARFEGDFAGAVDTWVRTMFPGDADPALVDAIANDMAAAPPAVGLNAIRHTLAWWDGTAQQKLERLFANLVCVNSDHWPTNAEGNREIVPGFRVWIMPDTGHFLMREKPDEFNALLAEALATFGFAMPGKPSPPRMD